MKDRIEYLRSEISRHDELYFVQNRPEISDDQYDAMFAKLVELEQEYPEYADPNSPSARVGSDLANRFRIHQHPVPMLSIKSLFTEEAAKNEINNYLNSPPSQGGVPAGGGGNSRFFVMAKYDGIAIELHYNKAGELTLALTRGNGYQGSDVTANIRTIVAIPKKIPPQDNGCIVRGEIFLTQKEFRRLNRLRKKNGFELYTNIRNAAASLVRAKQSSQTAVANLSAVFFYVRSSNYPDSKFESYFSGMRTWLTINGFNNPESWGYQPEADEVVNLDKLMQVVRNVLNTKHDFPFDGAVVRLETAYNNSNTRYQTGTWAVKTNSPVWETTLRFVSWNVSKKGKLTPIAHFEPFTEAGSTFTRANLGSIENIQELALYENARIHVQIAGFTTPQVIYCEKANSDGNCPPASRGTRPEAGGGITAPVICPCCHQPLSDGRCINKTGCPAFENNTHDSGLFDNYRIAIQVPRNPDDGPGIYRTACIGHDAIIVRTKKNVHDYMLLANDIKTVAHIGVTVGRMAAGPHTFEKESDEELLQMAREEIRRSNQLLNF